MGASSLTRGDLIDELRRVYRHIEQAIFDLSDAKSRLAANPLAPDAAISERALAEIATTCISLELALADSVVWAQRLTEGVRRAGAIGAAERSPRMFCDG